MGVSRKSQERAQFYFGSTATNATGTLSRSFSLKRQGFSRVKKLISTIEFLYLFTEFFALGETQWEKTSFSKKLDGVVPVSLILSEIPSSQLMIEGECMKSLRQKLTNELRNLPGMEEKIWPDHPGFTSFNYKGKEVAHFDSNNEIDVRLTTASG